jgi:hypothetical protein
LRTSGDTSQRLDSTEEGTDEREARASLGHPLAYLVTVAALIAVFAWPYLLDANRSAPTWDPAFYTWRTEAFIAEPPEAVLEMRGVLGMYDRGYRIGTPLLGTFLRNVAGVSSLRMTIVLTVVLPVMLALLLAGVAESIRPGPLTFHVTALASGGLLFMPPFVGYLDNLLCLVLLTAALLFIARANGSRSARIGAGLCMIAAGFVHPTSLAIFCGVAIGVAFLSMVISPRHVLQRARAERPTLITVAVAAGVVFAAWRLGIWGVSAPLADAALPPPYAADRFLDRLGRWIDAMYWKRNVPLLGMGAVVVVAALRARRDRITSLTLFWLVPLIGVFGWLADLAYPYYRFLNATPVWAVLFGVGSAAVIAWAVRQMKRPVLVPIGLLVIGAVVVVMTLNIRDGFVRYGPSATGARAGWLSAAERADLDALRRALETTDEARPVVLVVNFRPGPQVWGTTKLAGSTARYGVPGERLRDTHVYLGDVQNLALGTPTLRSEPTYDRLSRALFEDRQDSIGDEDNPIVVLASTFNRVGANAKIARGKDSINLGSAGELWTLHKGVVTSSETNLAAPGPLFSGQTGWVRIVLGLAGGILLLLPGLVFCVGHREWGRLPLALGLIPGLSAALLIVSAIALLAVVPIALSPAATWGALGLATAAAFGLRHGTRPSPARLPRE